MLCSGIGHTCGALETSALPSDDTACAKMINESEKCGRAQETDHRRCSCHRRTLWKMLRTDRGCSAHARTRTTGVCIRRRAGHGRGQSPASGVGTWLVCKKAERGNPLEYAVGGKFVFTTPESGRSRTLRPHPEKLVDDLGASSRPDVTLPRISPKNACTASSSDVIHYYHLPVPNSGGHPTRR